MVLICLSGLNISHSKVTVNYCPIKYTEWLKPLVNYLAIRHSSSEKNNINLFPLHLDSRIRLYVYLRLLTQTDLCVQWMYDLQRISAISKGVVSVSFDCDPGLCWRQNLEHQNLGHQSLESTLEHLSHFLILLHLCCCYLGSNALQLPELYQDPKNKYFFSDKYFGRKVLISRIFYWKFRAFVVTSTQNHQ